MQTFFRHVAWPSLLILLLCQRIQGQNLVPNPSFEDVNTCAEFSQPCSPSAWFFLSRRLTTGYFPRFPSATGSRHLQIVAANDVDRELSDHRTLLAYARLKDTRRGVDMLRGHIQRVSSSLIAFLAEGRAANVQKIA